MDKRKLSDRDIAIRKVSKLNDELREHGWEPDVFENLGWHYALRKGENSIHQHGDTCTAYIWLGGQQFLGDGSTAKKALKDAIKKAQSLAKRIAEDTPGLLL